MKTGALVLLLGLVVARPAVSEVTVEVPTDPVEGRPLVLTFTDNGSPASGLEVTARSRDQAHEALRKEESLGATGADGTLSWTPRQPGVAVLAWEGGTHNLSVLHDGVPTGAVVIGLFAGLLLLGGSVLFFVAMLREKGGHRFEEMAREVEEVGEPPST